MMKEIKTNLEELIGQFAYDNTGKKIKYLIVGDTDISILSLENITASCKYDFDIQNILNTNKFEYDNVELEPECLYGYNKFKFKIYELIKILKRNYDKISYNGVGVINYSKLLNKQLKQMYKFSIDPTTNIVYCICKRLIVDNSSENYDLFAGLEELIDDDRYFLKDSNGLMFRYITIEQYKILMMCINSIK